MNPVRRAEILLLAQDRDIVHLLVLALERLDELETLTRKIAMDQATLAKTLTDLATQVGTSTTQITTDIQELESAINAGNGTTPEVDAALDALRTSLAGLASAIPDPSTLPGAPAPAPAPAPSAG